MARVGYTKVDKYESGVVLYWVEDEVEGKWSKKSSTSRTELAEYEVPLDGEDMHAFGTSTASLDPSNMHGPRL